MLKRFLKDPHASVLIIAGLGIFILVAVAGAAIDLGRSQIVQLKMQQAADAAALAAARGIGLSEAERRDTAVRTFSLNFPDNYMGSSVTAADMRIAFLPNIQNLQAVNIQLDSSLETNFVRFVGPEEMGIGVQTEVTAGGAPLDLDVILVADGTSSMNGQRVAELRDAARVFADVLLNPNNLRAGDLVRISVYEYGWVNTIYINGQPAPAVPLNQLTMPKQDNPFSDDFNNVLDSVSLLSAPLDPTYYTNGGPTALATANRIIRSPQQSDGTFATTKAWVFLTDGSFNIPQVVGQKVVLNSVSALSEQMFVEACDQLRQNDVVRFTIEFGFYGASGILRDCASDPKADHYFRASPGSDDLERAFRDIALNLRKLVITR